MKNFKFLLILAPLDESGSDIIIYNFEDLC